jgi:hypothetical protein
MTETDPVSETLCFLFVEIRTMDKVQKLNSNECYAPSSEPFRNNGRTTQYHLMLFEQKHNKFPAHQQKHTQLKETEGACKQYTYCHVTAYTYLHTNIHTCAESVKQCHDDVRLNQKHSFSVMMTFGWIKSTASVSWWRSAESKVQLQCHDDVRLNQKYGSPSSVLDWGEWLASEPGQRMPKYQVAFTPEPVLALWRREKYFPCRESNSARLSHIPSLWQLAYPESPYILTQYKLCSEQEHE